MRHDSSSATSFSDFSLTRIKNFLMQHEEIISAQEEKDIDVTTPFVAISFSNDFNKLKRQYNQLSIGHSEKNFIKIIDSILASPEATAHRAFLKNAEKLQEKYYRLNFQISKISTVFLTFSNFICDSWAAVEKIQVFLSSTTIENVFNLFNDPLHQLLQELDIANSYGETLFSSDDYNMVTNLDGNSDIVTESESTTDIQSLSDSTTEIDMDAGSQTGPQSDNEKTSDDEKIEEDLEAYETLFRYSTQKLMNLLYCYPRLTEFLYSQRSNIHFLGEAYERFLNSPDQFFQEADKAKHTPPLDEEAQEKIKSISRFFQENSLFVRDPFLRPSLFTIFMGKHNSSRLRYINSSFVALLAQLNLKNKYQQIMMSSEPLHSVNKTTSFQNFLRKYPGVLNFLLPQLEKLALFAKRYRFFLQQLDNASPSMSLNNISEEKLESSSNESMPTTGAHFQRSTPIEAQQQKQFLTVNFFDDDGCLKFFIILYTASKNIKVFQEEAVCIEAKNTCLKILKTFKEKYSANLEAFSSAIFQHGSLAQTRLHLYQFFDAHPEITNFWIQRFNDFSSAASAIIAREKYLFFQETKNKRLLSAAPATDLGKQQLPTINN